MIWADLKFKQMYNVHVVGPVGIGEKKRLAHLVHSLS